MTGRPWLPWKVAMAAWVLRPSRPFARPASRFSLHQQLLDFPDLGAGDRLVRRDCPLRGSRGRRRDGRHLAWVGRPRCWRLDRSMTWDLLRALGGSGLGRLHTPRVQGRLQPRQRLLPLFVAGLGRDPVPTGGHHRVGRPELAGFIKAAHLVGTARIAGDTGPAEPVHRLSCITRHAETLLPQRAERVSGIGFAPVGGAAVPIGGMPIVLRHALCRVRRRCRSHIRRSRHRRWPCAPDRAVRQRRLSGSWQFGGRITVRGMRRYCGRPDNGAEIAGAAAELGP